MNNKYDVNNFSKLIDDFNLENEVDTNQKRITDYIQRIRRNNNYQNQIFDPIMDDQNSRYQAVKFQYKRINLETLSEKLLSLPPLRIMQHAYKDEIINHVLDKAFVDAPLHQDYIEAIDQCFMKYDNRDIFLKFLE